MKGHGLHQSEHLTLDELVGREGAYLVVAVEDAQLAVALLDAGVVAGEAAADEDLVPAERDFAARADRAGVLPGVVMRLGQGGRAAPLAGPPAFDGRPVVQRLVGAAGVVDGPPVLGVGVGVGVEVGPLAPAGVERDELADAGAVEPLDLALSSGGGTGGRGWGRCPGGSGGRRTRTGRGRRARWC